MANRTREYRLDLWLSNAERRVLEQLAESRGLKPSQLLRVLLRAEAQASVLDGPLREGDGDDEDGGD